MSAPSWHGDVLQQRDASRQQGNEEPINWEEAKQDILKKTSHFQQNRHSREGGNPVGSACVTEDRFPPSRE